MARFRALAWKAGVGLTLVALLLALAVGIAYVPRSVTFTQLQVSHTVKTEYLVTDIAVDPVTGVAYVVEGGNYTTLTGGTLLKVNGTDGSVLDDISLGGIGDAVAVDPTSNTIFVTGGTYPGYVLAINGTTGRVMNSLSLGNQGYWNDIAADPAIGRVFVTTFDYSSGLVSGFTNTVPIIDAKTLKVIVNVTVGDFPMYVAVDSVTGVVYVTGEHGNQGVMFAIDGESGEVVANVTVGTFPGWVAVNPSTDRVYVAGIFAPLFVMSGASGRPIANVTVGSTGVSWSPSAVAVDPSTDVVYAVSNCQGCNPWQGGVFAINGTTDAVIANLTFTGQRPAGQTYGLENVAVDPTTHLVYFSGPGNQVLVVGGYGSADPPKTLTAGVNGGLPGTLRELLPLMLVALVVTLAYAVSTIRSRRRHAQAAAGESQESSASSVSVY